MSAPTVDVTADRRASSGNNITRTTAATQARRRSKAEKLCAELSARLDTLDGPLLTAMTVKLLAECDRRRLATHGRPWARGVSATVDEFVDGAL